MHAIKYCRRFNRLYFNYGNQRQSALHYLILSENFVQRPTIIDKDRTRRGDFFKKPTAYRFVNCSQTNSFTNQQTPINKQKKIATSKSGIRDGICSEDRSLISNDYARNFICDWVIGKAQPNIELTLFDLFD